MKSNVEKSYWEWVEKQMDIAWDKMGDAGSAGYFTKESNWNEENYWFGYFKALEDSRWKDEDLHGVK